MQIRDMTQIDMGHDPKFGGEIRSCPDNLGSCPLYLHGANRRMGYNGGPLEVNTAVRKTIVAIGLAALLGLSCGPAVETDGEAYTRYLRCADGVSNEHSLHLM